MLNNYNNTIICTVLKTSEEYKIEYVQKLNNNLKKFNLNNIHYCLTNENEIENVNTIKFNEDLPGWWSKLNLFDNRLAIKDYNIFYIDIDTVIVKDITKYLIQDKFTMLTDFYYYDCKKEPASSGVMYIPTGQIRDKIFNDFIKDKENIMRKFVIMPAHGDQGYIHSKIKEYKEPLQRWQHIYNNEIVSYKKDVLKKLKKSEGNGFVPRNAHIISFHGNPRPWDKNTYLINFEDDFLNPIKDCKLYLRKNKKEL